MTTIAVANQKGGVAKTTTATNLAAALANKGHATLLIDLDPQANATHTFPQAPVGKSIYDVLNETTSLDDATRSISEHLSLVASNANVGKLEPMLSGPTMYYRLESAIRSSGRKYEFVILDCPPSLGNLTINALLAATHLIIPITPGTYAVQGLQDLMTNTRAIQERVNPKLRLLGVLVTKAETRKRLHKEIIEYLTEQFGAAVFTTIIRNNVSIDEASAARQSIYQYAPHSAGAEDYLALTNEILARIAAEGTRA